MDEGERREEERGYSVPILSFRYIHAGLLFMLALAFFFSFASSTGASLAVMVLG